MNMVECKDKTCRQGTKLYSQECYEPNEEGEYEDDDGQAYMVRCFCWHRKLIMRQNNISFFILDA